MGNRLKLAIFISGRGSNMDSLIAACEAPDFPAEVILVLSNRPDAGGLAKAKAKNIPTEIVDHKNYESREAFEAVILESLKGHDFDVICLAGFMRLLSASFTEKFEGRLINIHPSLLPKHKGLNTHERAIQGNESEAGCTVHYVSPEMDSGEIIVQRTVPILSNDTPEILAKRVLSEEHIAYPEAIKILANTLLNS